jgi:hypothetical protein
MPFYIFQHPKTEETVEVQQRMKDDHVYIDQDGVEWKRVFTNPNAAIDTRPDVYSTAQMARSVDNKKETYGELQDRSKEASEKRISQNGYDPLKQQWFDDYAKTRKGKRHIKDPKAGESGAKIVGVDL